MANSTKADFNIPALLGHFTSTPSAEWSCIDSEEIINGRGIHFFKGANGLHAHVSVERRNITVVVTHVNSDGKVKTELCCVTNDEFLSQLQNGAFARVLHAKPRDPYFEPFPG